MMIEKDKIRERMKSIKVFVLDMDGTIYLGKDLFPYTHRFLNTVMETKRNYYFFTNNSSRDIDAYITKLDHMGIHIERNQMMVSTHVILRWLEKHHKGKRVYVVGTPALRKEFEAHGWVLDEEQPQIVILGFDTTLTYEKLSKACTFIREGALYYGINPDLNCPMEHNTFIPDCGSMAKLIEASTGKYPEFFGKPSPKTLEYIIEETGYEPEQIAIIGDRLYTDIAVANGSEVTSVLVLSGETQEDDIKKSEIKPDIIIQDIGELADLI
ncbi:HAD-IIA family hydrolase [Amedibacillus sp. YH-ame10]